MLVPLTAGEYSNHWNHYIWAWPEHCMQVFNACSIYCFIRGIMPVNVFSPRSPPYFWVLFFFILLRHCSLRSVRCWLPVSACNVGDLGWIPGSGRSPGEGNGNPLQYSCLENPMDRGAWWAAVYRVAKSRTQLNDFTFTFTFFPIGLFPSSSFIELDSINLQCFWH